MRIAAISIIVATVGLIGCQGWYQGDENSPFFLPSAGSTLVLNENISISPEKTSIYLQGGKIVDSFWKVNIYYPYCKLELRTRRPVEQTIGRDNFIIQRVSRYTSFVPTAQDTHTGHPGGVLLIQHGGTNGGMTLYSYVTELYLHSDRQPNVYRLACQQKDYPATGEHLSVNDMRRALGDILTLRLASRIKP